ncbi:hypothetical protein HZA43_02550 [Candidatus Peregrinibacteria bacterium]|nr:hypothetical protein [Candidatus Peregrinibacteria bacterium]
MAKSILSFAARAGTEEVKRPIPDTSPLRAKYSAVILSVRADVTSSMCQREGCLSPKNPAKIFSVEYRPVGLITRKGARVPIPSKTGAALDNFRERFNVCLACVLEKMGKNLR